MLAVFQEVGAALGRPAEARGLRDPNADIGPNGGTFPSVPSVAAVIDGGPPTLHGAHKRSGVESGRASGVHCPEIGLEPVPEFQASLRD